jgi:ABC-2 type transport system permease protein
MSALLGFMRKEVHHILRDRRTLTILLMLPLAQVLLFGFAVRTDIDSIRLAVVDPVPDALSLSLQSRFQGTTVFDLVTRLPSTELLEERFRAGEIDQALVFPPDFGSAMQRPGGAALQIITDATDPNTGSTMQAYATSVVGDWQLDRVEPGGVRIVPTLACASIPRSRA